MSDPNEAFTGSKIALFHDGRVLVYLRDDKTSIPFPAGWDLPGGGRENDETPDECALRELFEELGLRLDPSRIVWRQIYPSWSNPHLVSHFMVAHIGPEDIAQIVFGNEGQRWEMMPVAQYLAHEACVPHLRDRLRDAAEANLPAL
ncbi:MAG: NUDIX hydrolase [Terricaulis sp.]